MKYVKICQSAPVNLHKHNTLRLEPSGNTKSVTGYRRTGDELRLCCLKMDVVSVRLHRTVICVLERVPAGCDVVWMRVKHLQVRGRGSLL